MRNLFKVLVIGILSAFLVTGCAKPPTQEMTAAKAQVEAATTADAQSYAATELTQLASDLKAAEDEVKIQDEKWFGNFNKAKEMLAAIKTSADNVTAVASQRKEEAKQTAITTQSEAVAAIEAAKALLAQAPKGKETKAEIEILNADLTGAQESLAGIQTSIDQEKYTEAKDSANLIKEKAASVSSQVQAALDKKKKK
jgi:tRNA U34 5-carboxymethylaminomethyl modifying GTPase MnmE/TrmE